MGERRQPTKRQSAPTRAMVLAWGDRHSIEISNGEADDLVRRLHSMAIPFEDAEVVERCVTDALLLMAEGFEDDEVAVESLRKLAVKVSDTMLALGLVEKPRCVLPDAHPIPSGGVPDMTAPPCDDDAPGAAMGEDGGRPLRFDRVYRKPVRVTIHGRRLVALHPPFDGRVRLRAERGGTRAIVVPLDELTPSDRTRLKAPTLRRQEIWVRCANRRCGSVFRAWLADGDELSIQETGGRFISDVRGVFSARCEEHRLTR